MSSTPPTAPSSRSGLSQVVRVILSVLALIEVAIGAWQLFAPYSFYTYFPAGQGWVERLGPYDQHLITDVGELTLALETFLTLAALVFERRLVQVALVGYLVQAVPHLVFHAIHREHMSTAQNVANLATLALAVIVPAGVLWLSLRWPEPDASARHRTAFGSRS